MRQMNYDQMHTRYAPLLPVVAIIFCRVISRILSVPENGRGA
jgi:hypothetical protein